MAVAITIYTWGYTQTSSRSPKKVDELRHIRAERNALIVDTRIKPFSRFRQWAMPYLQRTFGDDYMWVQEFGNVNFDSWTKPIVLFDPAAGLTRLEPLVRIDRPPLLLCMCPTIFCHRTEVAKYLKQHAGWTIEHLVPEDRRSVTLG
jgi:hypothetical protein